MNAHEGLEVTLECMVWLYSIHAPTAMEFIMDISVIVITYNRVEQLGKVLTHLIQQETRGRFTFELMVIDNASTDGTMCLLEEMAQQSRVSLRFVQEATKGVAHARNRGIREAKGQWLAFFDDDQLADPFWLWELVAVAQKMNVSCVGGCIRLKLPAQEKHDRLSPFCRSILGETMQCDESKKYPAKSLPGTGNVLLKREVFTEVGKFDTTFSRGGEDADFFRRVVLHGFDIWYAPKALAYHLIPQYRIEESYLLWTSLRHGVNYAFMDNKEQGPKGLVMSVVARTGQALLIHLPCLLIAFLQGNRVLLLGRKCFLYKAVGYLRATLFLLAPTAFPQQSFFAGLQFYTERISFKK